LNSSYPFLMIRLSEELVWQYHLISGNNRKSMDFI
jgi:hypothetical protein